MIINWDKDYNPANSRPITLRGPLCIVEKTGRLSAQVFLRLLVKRPIAESDVRMLRLRLMDGQYLLTQIMIQLPSADKDSSLISAMDLGPFIFDNLRLNAGQNFAVVLECFAGEQLMMGLQTFTSLQVMWFPPTQTH